MGVVKLIGLIFLAVYLILTGLSAVLGLDLGYYARAFVELVAIAAGILILISAREFAHHEEHHH